MKVLYYNPLEIPQKVHIVSAAFGIDVSYEEPYTGVDLDIGMDELFNLSKCDSFDEVAVYFTLHNEAYTRNSKKDVVKTPVIGWFSLKGVAKGGGYLEDKLR